jgi:asparagine synthase (glutamine-hydrolysing)
LPSGAEDGVFAAWNWDGQALTARNDRFGCQPIFCFVQPGEICLSSSVNKLIERGAPRDLDHAGLAVYMRLGFFLAEDTPFAAIRVLPPHATLRWTPTEGLSISAVKFQPAAQSMSRDAAISTYRELFAEAVRRRRPDGPFGVTLSGGRDSRHILLELLAQGCRPDVAATIDQETSEDGPIAAALAKATGVPHLLVKPYRRSLTHEMRKNTETNFCADEHTWILALRDELRGRVATLYDGIAGDVLSAGLFLDAGSLDLFRRQKIVDLARRMIHGDESAPYMTRFLLPEVAARFGEDLAVHRLAAELARHVDAANPCGSFCFWNRTRREIALSPYALFADFRTFAPFLDPDLVKFLSGLPAEHFLDRRFHDDTIARSYPQWANIPYSRKCRAPFRLWNLAYAWRILGRLARRPGSLNLRHLAPRIVRAGLDPRYNRAAIDDLTTFAVYWTQIEELCETETLAAGKSG